MSRCRSTTKVYVVEDSLTIRAMLDTLLSQRREFQVCGIASSAESALDDIPQVEPEIVLLDLALPGMDGLELLAELRKKNNVPQVIVLSSAARAGDPVCRQAFRKGAVACFDKSKLVASLKELTALLEEVRDGEIHPERYQDGAVSLPPTLQ